VNRFHHDGHGQQHPQHRQFSTGDTRTPCARVISWYCRKITSAAGQGRTGQFEDLADTRSRWMRQHVLSSPWIVFVGSSSAHSGPAPTPMLVPEDFWIDDVRFTFLPRALRASAQGVRG
jgi:hypothetical protein